MSLDASSRAAPSSDRCAKICRICIDVFAEGRRETFFVNTLEERDQFISTFNDHVRATFAVGENRRRRRTALQALARERTVSSSPESTLLQPVPIVSMPVNSALSAPPVKKIGRTVIPVTDENGNYRFPCPSPPPIIVSHRTASAFHTNSPGPSAASRLSRGGSEAGLSRTTSVTLSSILNFTARLSLSSRLGESSLLFPSSSSAAAATEQQGRTEEMETETTEVSFEEVTLYCEETEENSDSPTQRGMDTLHCDSQWHEETGRTGVEEQTEAHPQSHPEAGSAFCLLDFLNDDAWRDRRDRRASLMKKKAKEKKKREREGLEFWARCLENMD